MLTPADRTVLVPLTDGEGAANDAQLHPDEDLRLQALEEPVLRLVFRDQAGVLQTTTVRSTWGARLGTRHAEARKRAIYRACKTWYESLGMELISVYLVRVHETSIL